MNLVWFPPLLITMSLIPRGAVGQPFLGLCLLAISIAFAVSLSRSITVAGSRRAVTCLLAGTQAYVVIALPLVALTQAIAQTLSMFSAGPLIEMSDSAMLFSGYTLFYLLVRRAAADQRATRFLLGCLAVAGALEAGYGVLNLLSGNEYLLFGKREAYFDSATGTLISRNHFSFLMELLFPSAVAFSICFAAKEDAPGTDRTPESEATARGAFAGLSALLLALALLFSRCRMGIVSFVMAAVAVWVTDRAVRPRTTNDSGGHRRLAVPILVGATFVVLVAAIGLDPVLDRFFHLQHDLETGRWPIWKATLAMIADRPIFGHGFGTFEALLPGYRPGPTGFFFNHAHNEYLEVLAEGGIVGISIVAWMIVLFVRRSTSVLASPLTTTQRSMIVCLAIGIVSVLLHSTADFGLRVPGVAFTFVYVAAVFSRVTEDPSLLDSPRIGSHRRRNPRSRA